LIARVGTHPSASHDSGLSVSVVVPTYQRANRLASCLEGLHSQTRPADEVLVVVQGVDEASANLVSKLAGNWPELRYVRVAQPGVVAALNSGLAAACGAIVALVDDDAVATADWLERIVKTFECDDRVAAVGGRDVIDDGGRIMEPARRRGLWALKGEPGVGRIQWFGRMLGNHHIGVGAPRDVDVLKGANMSFRREAVLAHGVDDRLRGEGAQEHWELSICLPLRRRGLRVVYDPNISVLHYPAPRHRGRERDDFSSEAVTSSTYNEALEILDYLGPIRRLVFISWGLGVGTTCAPGLAVLARDLLHRRPAAWMRFTAAQHGRFAAWRSHLRTPRVGGQG
jgi:cellulose synthase/poly-beta-1,6-N-acetylglucosamine synthase-like glycosyltransferase